jgi:hypothetical protein
MTSRRVALLLLAGLAVVAFGVWLSSKRHLERATLAGDLVLPGLESTLNSITEVRLSKGDNTHTTLKKTDSGWVVSERDYPADSGKVRKLLLDFGALNVVEEKTRVSANYPQLGVEDVNSPKATGTRVEIVTPAKTYAVIVGKSSSAKSGYVRVASSEQSLLAAPLVTVDADPKHWLDHTLVDIPQERVKEVEAKPAEGPAYTAARDKKEQPDFTVSPIPKGRELANPTVADPIAGSLVSLTLDDVRKAGAPNTANDPKPSHAIFHTFDGLELDVAGHKEGTQPYIAITARSTAKETEHEAQKLNARSQGWEFEIPAYKYDAIFKPLDDLLQKPPEPAKKADAAKKPGTKPKAGK